jgi:hypothetical protein
VNKLSSLKANGILGTGMAWTVKHIVPKLFRYLHACV